MPDISRGSDAINKLSKEKGLMKNNDHKIIYFSKLTCRPTLCYHICLSVGLPAQRENRPITVECKQQNGIPHESAAFQTTLLLAGIVETRRVSAFPIREGDEKVSPQRRSSSCEWEPRVEKEHVTTKTLLQRALSRSLALSLLHLRRNALRFTQSLRV